MANRQHTMDPEQNQGSLMDANLMGYEFNTEPSGVYEGLTYGKRILTCVWLTRAKCNQGEGPHDVPRPSKHRIS